MLTSSESIGALAAALARAQQELTNPEKSLTATLAGVAEREQGRTFRYASLASGLDIVRKSLGRQEIAALQTTAIDRGAGHVQLTTTLAHSSGEWVSSEWPVCPVAEMADPQRMGAALTYARRYALFTLVGIAGEDDLDAPAPTRATSLGNGRSSDSTPPLDPHQGSAPRSSHTSARKQPAPGPILSSEASSALREKLLASVAALNSAEALTDWAMDSMPTKNTLVDEDVRAIETAFEAKRSELGEPTDTSVDSALNSAAEAASPLPRAGDAVEWTPTRTTRSQRTARRAGHRETNRESHPAGSLAPETSLVAVAPSTVARQLTAVDKSALTFDEPKRVRDKEHLRHVAAQPCVLCSARPAEAHHIRFAQPRALGRKVSDQFTVPLCHQHHRDVHHSGNEAAWWHDTGIDPIEVALQLWDETLIARGFVSPPLLPSDATEGTKQAKCGGKR
jgi:hypothetical protein